MWFTRGIAAEGGRARLGSISVSRRGGQLHFQPQRRLLININTQAPSLHVCREFIVPATRQPLCKYWRMVDFMGGLWFRERGWKGGSLLVYTRKICRFFLTSFLLLSFFSIKRLKCECFRIFSVKPDKIGNEYSILERRFLPSRDHYIDNFVYNFWFLSAAWFYSP